MKKGYLEISLFFLLAYFRLDRQFAMARHTHHHRQLNSDCYRCPPGSGVERHCNQHHDTECMACAPDHYSSHHSARRPCYPCSRCGFGLYIAHRCTPSKDTVCDSCHTYRGPHNEDFYERCVKPLLSNGTHNTIALQKESEAFVTVEAPNLVPSSVIIVSGMTIGLVAVVFVVTCFIITNGRHCKRVNHRYSYEAVATQEAVML